MIINGTQLELTCTGPDSGIAIDRIGKELPAGPYALTFRLRSEAAGSGEVYFTTDPATKLPNGEHIEFDVLHNGEWQDVTLKLNTTKSIRALRVDPCSKPGNTAIADLQLLDAKGKTLMKWPAD